MSGDSTAFHKDGEDFRLGLSRLRRPSKSYYNFRSNIISSMITEF